MRAEVKGQQINNSVLDDVRGISENRRRSGAERLPWGVLVLGCSCGSLKYCTTTGETGTTWWCLLCNRVVVDMLFVSRVMTMYLEPCSVSKRILKLYPWIKHQITGCRRKVVQYEHVEMWDLVWFISDRSKTKRNPNVIKTQQDMNPNPMFSASILLCSHLSNYTLVV